MQLEDHAAAALDLGVYELLRQRLIQVYTVAAPAAGAEILQAVPTGVAWELLSVRYSLVTSAVVANRSSLLRVLNPDNVVVEALQPQAVQAAGITRAYQRILGAVSPVGLVEDFAPLGDGPLLLPSGWKLGTLTAGIDVGDQYSAAVIMVREWSLTAIVQTAKWMSRKQLPT